MQENYNKGWISIYRSIFSHWLAPKSRAFTRLEAWLFILIEVNHAPKKVMLGHQVYICERGDSLKSLNSWARHFNWSKSRVRRFFLLLENENMITRKEHPKTTHLTVCNYDSYQSYRHPNDTPLDTPSETQAALNNNANKLITNNNIYKGVLKSEIYFDQLKKLHSLSDSQIKKLFRQFFNINYAENLDPFKESDVKRYFGNKLPDLLKKQAKKPTNKKGATPNQKPNNRA